MKLNTIGYFISDAFKSLKRNATISIASMATVFMTLLIFGAFLLAALNINTGIINEVESKVEIKVFLKDTIGVAEKNDVEAAINGVEGIQEVIYESKEDALAKFKDQLKDNKAILEGYDEKNNPMPSSFVVRLDSPEIAQSVEEAVKDMPGVEEVGNDQDIIKTITSFSKGVKWVGIVLFVILIGVSLFLIVNTIKITVYSRRREVGIMKFVGATDWFIRWPFIIEGIVIGLVGSVCANLALFGLYNWGYGKIVTQLYMIKIIEPMYILSHMSWQFVVAGVLIGMFGSIIALRKFLKV